jgi:hypothetical protein
MTWRDKLELGLKEDAAYRKDNLPPSQVRGRELPTGPGRSPEIPLARGDRTQAVSVPSARRHRASLAGPLGCNPVERRAKG